jgi:hypothetical protein
MEAIEELKKQVNASGTNSYRMFDAMPCGKYLLSIQGSEGHYCSPRQTLYPDLYEDMEIAIFCNEEWVHPTKSRKLKAFPRYNELIERADGISPITVYGYVPIDLINDLYLYLKGE